MNFIGAFLLLAGLDEEDAFWCLIALVDRVVPGYFSEGMAAAKLDQRVFARLLHAHLPAVGLHLESLAPDDIVTGIISSQWLLTLFVNVLPARATMRVWDRVFAARDRAPLFAACIALLEPNAAAVLDAGDMGEAIELLQGLGDVVSSDEASVDDFAARVDARLEGAIAPDKLSRETARERGRRRRPSDAGLPERARATSPVNEVDELVVGLASDLRDVVGPRALARLDAEAGRENENASTSDGGDGDGDWEFADAPREMGMAWAEGLIAAGAGSGGDPGGDSGGDWGDGLVDAAAAIRRMAAGGDRGDARGDRGDARGDRGDASAAASDETFVSGSGSLALAFGSPLASSPASSDPASGFRAEEMERKPTASLDLLGVDRAGPSNPANPADLANPAGLALPPEDAERIADCLLDVDRRLRALPTRASAFARAARITATRPLAATRTSRLDALRAEFARDETEFRLLTQRALALGNKGLSWRAGAGVAGGLEQGGALWTAWADSLFEHVFRRADALLLSLERVAAELNWVVDAVRGEPGPDESTNENQTRDVRDATTASTPPNDATVAAARRRHAARLRDELRAVVSRVERCASDAARDAPTPRRTTRRRARNYGARWSRATRRWRSGGRRRSRGGGERRGRRRAPCETRPKPRSTRSRVRTRVRTRVRKRRERRRLRDRRSAHFGVRRRGGASGRRRRGVRVGDEGTLSSQSGDRPRARRRREGVSRRRRGSRRRARVSRVSIGSPPPSPPPFARAHISTPFPRPRRWRRISSLSAKTRSRVGLVSCLVGRLFYQTPSPPPPWDTSPSSTPPRSACTNSARRETRASSSANGTDRRARSAGSSKRRRN